MSNYSEIRTLELKAAEVEAQQVAAKEAKIANFINVIDRILQYDPNYKTADYISDLRKLRMEYTK